MSTSTLPEPPPASASKPDAAGNLGRELATARQRLRQQKQRARNGIWIEMLGLVALLLIAYAIPTFITDRLLRLEWIVRAVLLGSFAIVVVRVVRRRLMQPLDVQLSDEEIALAVERQSPELEQSLISSLQFDEELGQSAEQVRSIESREMKAAVVDDIRNRIHAIPFGRAIDGGRVRKFAFGVVLMLAFFGAWAAIHSSSLGTWASRNLLLSNVDWPRYHTLSFVGSDDGVVRLPQGDALTVRVAIDGPELDQVSLDYSFANGSAAGDTGTEPMSRTGDKEFSWSIDSVLSDVTLTVQGGDSLPVELKVQMVARPRVDDLAVRVTLPEYMEREPFDMPPTEGELRLPRGATLTIRGKSQKPLQQAFALFGNDRKIPFEMQGDGRSFVGEFAPKQTGLLTIDVIDSDSLGAGTPPKILLRVGEDKSPTIDGRLRGIGSSITAQARIPVGLNVRDDFGLREVGAVARWTEDRSGGRVQPKAGGDEGEEGSALPIDNPWVDAAAIYDDALMRSSLRYETESSVDLLTWNKDTNQASPNNPIRPGMLFSLRHWARDNFGPGDPHEGSSEVMTFRVVTRDQLVEELRRRQIEQRDELQTLADQVENSLVQLGESVNPKEAGDKAALAKTLYKSLARRQQALGRRVRFVGEAYQRILWEYENNRLIEANKVRQIESVITAPLAQLAKDAFPATARLVESFSRTGDESVRSKAVDGYRDIKIRIDAILKQMEQAEKLAALLEELRNVINLQSDAITGVKERVRSVENDLFGPKKKNKAPAKTNEPSTTPDKNK
ncbi:MAG: hypothetical protein AB8H80_03825 [Planctomycetota bacterium]